ncbi:gluconolactonase [Terriglobus roseus DSM 18391]|uniref:Gluconolactonase n=1 Tax=Terriglobus roseus (strain DSM 18391 / NRRL B-41598 / KBS 63) TaxID=926566 RepID=I3ZDF3_TERRK|nr:SMP-30/gluconolactonase/LRE family protein [Terriglobus roseus]AFL87271.1 gluconolactonase [Terriglobus roseus DSM 18391]
MTLLDHLRGHADPNAPHLVSVSPIAAMPDGVVDLRGTHLGGALLPLITIGETPAPTTLTSPTRVTLRVPDGAISGDVILQLGDSHSNALPLRVALPIADNLHPIANPAIDGEGNIYATFSGSRGQEVPVSIFRIDREYSMRAFVRGLPNASGLAFGPDGYLYCSSRAEGTVYRISPDGAMAQWAEGMGIATGLAFDDDGNCYVGDRSGTIFKLDLQGSVFVFATLEPSVSAYHLAFTNEGTLLVTGPTTSSNEAIHAISPEGEVSTWYRGLGRPQGMAVDTDGNVYVASSLQGERGIIRITPDKQASVAISGSGLVGLAFTDDNAAVLATTSGLYTVEMDVEGRLSR